MGLALIFGVQRIVNFAHGAFLMVGMYATFLLFDKLNINPYYGFMTTGILLILTDGAQLIFGADYHQTNIELINRTLRYGPFSLNAASLLSFGIAGVLIVALTMFVTRSLTGQALRAIAQNPEVAPLMGINVLRIQGLSFALGTGLAGLAGGLLLPALYLFPGVGEDYTTKAFVIVVLGGMDSIEGAALGGLLLGVAESLTSLYVGNQWALVVDFALFLLVLSFKPSGIFGRQRA